MAEIALRTSEFYNRKEKYTAWRPVGSVIVAISDRAIRRKWAEMLCDFPSTAKWPHRRKRFIATWQEVYGLSRDEATVTTDRIRQAWSPRLLREWVDYDRLGKAAEDEQFWAEQIESLGILDDLPFDPTLNRPVWQTWVWSLFERQRYFIVTNVDATDAEIAVAANREQRQEKDGIVVCPMKMVDYRTKLGLSAETLAKIGDAAVAVHPRFDLPVAKAKVIRPTFVEGLP